MDSPLPQRHYPRLKLAYFPMGWRSTPIRVALNFVGIPFEFEQIPPKQWHGEKLGEDHARFPLGNIPVMYVDEVPMCESHAIYLYVGQLTGFWPTSPLDRVVLLRFCSL